MIDQAQIESLGRVITKLSERIAVGILMEATQDDYVFELKEELDKLTEAVDMLEMLKFPIPKVVNEVFRLYIDSFIEALEDE